MKYKVHKILQVSAIIVIALAIYASFKQVEEFQGQSTATQIVATDGTPGANLVQTVNNVINNPCVDSPTRFCATIPSWITPERKTAFINLNDLAKIKAPNNPNTRNDAKIITDNTYTMSKALNDDDGTTFDKIITNLTSYINNYVADRPNYYILMQYVNANPKPSWLTPAMISSYNAAQASLTAKNINPIDLSLVAKLQTIFTASINAGEANDVTFNKIVSGTTSFISDAVPRQEGSSKSDSSTPKTAESTTSKKNFKVPENLPLAIGVGVGLIAIIYLWIVFI